MERYRLSWVQSTSDFANSQDVQAVINGASAVPISVGQTMTVNQVTYDFPTGATVEWWIETTDDTGTKTVASVHHTFTAQNEAPLEPATGLQATWVEHIPS